jgi:cell division protein FtsW
MSDLMVDDLDHDERPEVQTTGFDMWLFGAAAALAVFGLVMVTSASSHYSLKIYDHQWAFGLRQLAGVVLGAVTGLLILRMPWVWFRKLSIPAFVLAVILLALVQTPLGHAAKGAPRWLRFGSFNVQPSEFAKIALAMVLAHHLARNVGYIKDVVGVVLPAVGVYLAPLLLLVFLQRDLGSIALLIGVAGVAFLVAGLEWRWVITAAMASLAGAVVLVISEPYRARRVLSFLDPHSDPEDGGYQVVQGWVALAVGGVTGQGLGNGVAQQGFLPEAHTDMILAVVAEELGVLGWAAAFLLHGILLWRGTEIASNARGLYEMVLAACLTAVMAAQVIVNTGVIAGLVPPKGLVLPFMSYGASAVLFHTMAVAILLRIGMENHRTAGG